MIRGEVCEVVHEVDHEEVCEVDREEVCEVVRVEVFWKAHLFIV